MTIPLHSAYLCADCQSIGADSHRCDCGSKHIMALAPILNRDIPDRALVIDSRDGMRFGGNVCVEWVRHDA